MILMSHVQRLLSRVYEVGRVSNGAYTNGEHCWESNVTFGVVHMRSIAHKADLAIVISIESVAKVN